MGKDITAYDSMRHQALGEPAGQAIFTILSDQEAADIWRVYADFTNAETRYHKVVLGKSMHAKTAKIEFLPERLETSADDEGPDLRDDDERIRSATNAWMKWQGYFGHLKAVDRSAILSVARGRAHPMKDGQITASGRVLVLALQNLVKAVDK